MKEAVLEDLPASLIFFTLQSYLQGSSSHSLNNLHSACLMSRIYILLLSQYLQLHSHVRFVVTTEKAVIDCPIQPAFPLLVNNRPSCVFGPSAWPIHYLYQEVIPSTPQKSPMCCPSSRCEEGSSPPTAPIYDPKTSSSHLKKSLPTSSLWSGGLKHSPVMLSPSLASPRFLNHKLLMSPLSTPHKSSYIQVALYHRGQPSLSSSFLFLKSLFPFTDILHLCKLSLHISVIPTTL